MGQQHLTSIGMKPFFNGKLQSFQTTLPEDSPIGFDELLKRREFAPYMGGYVETPIPPMPEGPPRFNIPDKTQPRGNAEFLKNNPDIFKPRPLVPTFSNNFMNDLKPMPQPAVRRFSNILPKK